jgi:membrane-associated phospholipid phosphatase
MEDLLGLDTWGLSFVEWVQSWGGGVLDVLAEAVTFLGDEEAYLILLPLLYWSIDKRLGRRLFLLAMFSTWGNVVLKNAFALPRPTSPGIVPKVEELGYGFPSNHAQTGAVAVWGYLAAFVRRRWFFAVAALLAVIIGMSRIYLGVHFPQDVIAGWILGAVVLAVTFRYQEPIAVRLRSLSLRGQMAAAGATALLVLVSVPADRMGRYPAETAGTLSGILLGAGIGIVLERRSVGFRTDGAVTIRAGRYLVGIILVAGIYLSGAAIPELDPWALDIAIRIIRYGAVGLAAMWLAPWVFVRTGLAEGSLPDA